MSLSLSRRMAVVAEVRVRWTLIPRERGSGGLGCYWPYCFFRFGVANTRKHWLSHFPGSPGACPVPGFPFGARLVLARLTFAVTDRQIIWPVSPYSISGVLGIL